MRETKVMAVGRQLMAWTPKFIKDELKKELEAGRLQTVDEFCDWWYNHFNTWRDAEFEYFSEQGSRQGILYGNIRDYAYNHISIIFKSGNWWFPDLSHMSEEAEYGVYVETSKEEGHCQLENVFIEDGFDTRETSEYAPLYVYALGVMDRRNPKRVLQDLQTKLKGLDFTSKTELQEVEKVRSHMVKAIDKYLEKAL